MSDINESRTTSTAGTLLRVLLWTVLVLTAAGNAVGSLLGIDTAVRLVLGGVAVVCIVTLVAMYLAGRRE
jgi:Na+(H+)/acetate symporter ActP